MRGFDKESKYPQYSFPLDSVRLKDVISGNFVEATVIQLTKLGAWWNIDRSWSKFRGPFAEEHEEQRDAHWKWHALVRRLRKLPVVRCAAIRTPDNQIQGSVIYRRDGASILEPNEGAVYVEYLATSPANRKGYAAQPRYSGVGEALLTLAIVHSYDWGLGGRVTLHSLPRAENFYKKYDFIETGMQKDRMIHYELTSPMAIRYLENQGLI